MPGAKRSHFRLPAAAAAAPLPPPAGSAAHRTCHSELRSDASTSSNAAPLATTDVGGTKAGAGAGAAGLAGGLADVVGFAAGGLADVVGFAAGGLADVVGLEVVVVVGLARAASAALICALATLPEPVSGMLATKSTSAGSLYL